MAQRRPGRPRDETIDIEIVRALFGCVEEVGLGSLTIDAIAERAGVSKATIYRRWESKEDLIVDAIAGQVGAVDIPDSDDVREVILHGLRRIETFMSKTPAGNVFPWVVGEVAAGTEIGQRYAEAVILPGRRALATHLARAKERGELRQDLDLELAVDMITGPLIVRKLMGDYHPADDGWTVRLVDGLLEGWRA